MKQLVAEQMLIVLNVAREAERPEWSVRRRHQIADASSNQDSNKMIVESPSRLVVARDGKRDETYHLIHNESRYSQRTTVRVARDEKRLRRPCDARAPGVRAVLWHGAVAVAHNIQDVIEPARRVCDCLVSDSRGRGFPKIRP
jgi:hypothetical protein